MTKRTIKQSEMKVTGNGTPEAVTNTRAEAEVRESIRSHNIVGIGASAGGLDALVLFLKNVPPTCGLSFVVVQHLDPNYKGILVELLQRATTMPVLQIKDHMRVEPDHVYVIPPNCDLSILHGVLRLHKPIAPRGLRLPIDFFFRSLAEDQEQNSIGVILSGMGSDGTLGLRAIKEKAGAAFVQDPDTAQFDGMPRSAIESGFFDMVVPAEELAARVVACTQNVPLLVSQMDIDLVNKDHSGLEKIVLILRAITGHDFSLYKKSTMYRRIERRMGLHQLSKIADYVRYLRENSKEAELLFRELLIGVTSFFRDAEVWKQIKDEAIPSLLAAHPKGGVLRAWVAACSTGEEAYSLAMVFREALEQIKPTAQYSLQIFATDLDQDAIDKARNGSYPTNIAADVSEGRLSRFFMQGERGYKVVKEIREMVIFAQQNLVMDPPFTKLDMLTCRNLLIYLEAGLQQKLLPLFHFSLNPHGILVLGSSETVGSVTDLFMSLSGKTRIYRRQENARRLDHVEFPTSHSRDRSRAVVDGMTSLAATPLLSEQQFSASLEKQTDRLLLQHYSPAAVLTNNKGDIVYISGKTGKYLEPAAGKANLNVFAMAREGLAGPLSIAFAKAMRQKITVTLKTVQVEGNGGDYAVSVTLQPLFEPAALNGMLLIVFADVEMPPVKKVLGKAARATIQGSQLATLTQEWQESQNELQATRQEMQQSHEELQTTREEMQTSQEELKSTNEELQSTNEELQSTNEELTTSKEEMQSMNEELHLLNHALQARVDELSQASDDMKNLLNSTDIVTLFLDDELKVRRFTTKTASIIKLIPGDAGRPITDLATELDYAQLVDDAREVLRTLIFKERQVPTHDGRWFLVRIVPYRTQSNRIDGLVITFVDISFSKALENSLREAIALLQNCFSDQKVPLDTDRTLEEIVQAAQVVLDKRGASHVDDIHQSLTSSVIEKAHKT